MEEAVSINLRILQDGISLARYMRRVGTTAEDLEEFLLKGVSDEKTFGGFEMKDLHEILGLFVWAELKGKTLEDLKELARRSKPKQRVRLASKPCPECGGIMKLSLGEEDMSDSQWTCKNCRFGEYVEKPFWEVIRDGETSRTVAARTEA